MWYHCVILEADSGSAVGLRLWGDRLSDLLQEFAIWVSRVWREDLGRVLIGQGSEKEKVQMKKLMIAASAMLCGAVAFGVESNIVG